MTAAVKITGLREFQRGLKDMDSELPKALRMALNASADLIVDDARPRIPRRSGKARGSVKAQSTQKAARVSGGGNRAPYYPWLDFGGRVGRRKSVRRPVLKDGRYIYRAYFANRGEFAELLEAEIVKVARKAGIEVT